MQTCIVKFIQKDYVAVWLIVEYTVSPKPASGACWGMVSPGVWLRMAMTAYCGWLKSFQIIFGSIDLPSKYLFMGVSCLFYMRG